MVVVAWLLVARNVTGAAPVATAYEVMAAAVLAVEGVGADMSMRLSAQKSQCFLCNNDCWIKNSATF